jgi:hypothetical protein
VADRQAAGLSVLGISRGLVGQFYFFFECVSFLFARLLCLEFACVKMRIVAMTLRRNRLNHSAHVRCTLGAGLGLHEYGVLGIGRGRRRWTQAIAKFTLQESQSN